MSQIDEQATEPTTVATGEPSAEPVTEQTTESMTELTTEPAAKPRPAWMIPAIAAGAAAILTLTATGIYVSSVIGQWEDHSAGLKSEVAALERDVDRLTDERDDALGEIATAEGRAEEAEGALAAATAELDARAAEIATMEQAVAAREAAVSTAEQRVKATTITTGTWVVGRDVEPGTYTTAGVASSDCYWGIYRSGTNGDDIIDNDLPGGGYPTVTLSVGQDFKTARCGDWVKQP